MDTRTLIDNLLDSAKSLKDKGVEVAEDKLNIPQAGAERDAMLSGMGKGALAAGALALLLGTRSGRSLTGGVLKLGSLAALGGLAYQGYRKWQAGNGGVEDNAPGDQAQEVSAMEDDVHSRLILSAMIGAAKADGHIDDSERVNLQNYIDKIGESAELTAFVESELSKPLDPSELASRVNSQEVAAEVYLASLLIIDQSNFMAKTYLSELAKALALPPELVASLSTEFNA